MSIKQLVVAGLFYFFIFLFGYWVSHSGKPYSVILLTIHKLISVAVVVYLVMAILQRNKVAALNTIELSVLVVTGLFFLCSVITGGLLSTDKSMPVAVQRLHQIIPYLTVLSTAVSLYLLLNHNNN